MADVLLVNPNGRSLYRGLGDLPAVEPPVWCGIIAGYLKQENINPEILDANALNMDAQAVALEVERQRPTLVALVVYGHNPSASTQNMPETRRIIKAIRGRMNIAGIPMAILGGHVSALIERTMEEEDAQYILGDEGLRSLAKAFELASTGTMPESKMMLSSSLVKELDKEIPDIPWDLFPMDKYRAHNWHCFGGLDRKPYASIYTSLGCPYNCTYCCINAPFRFGEKLVGVSNSYRMWKPETVVGWLERLSKDYGVRNVKFADEIFMFNWEHVEGICDLIIKKKLDFNIWAYARVDRLKEDLLVKMKKAGINWLCLGIESGAQAVRKAVNKGYNQQTIFDAVKMIHDAGIHIIGNYMFGLPEDTLETMQETLDLAQQLNTEYVNFYCAVPYPGSKLYADAKADGTRLPNSWEGYAQLSPKMDPMDTKHISGKDVLKFRDEAFHKYFTNRAYLEMMVKEFGGDVTKELFKVMDHRIERE